MNNLLDLYNMFIESLLSFTFVKPIYLGIKSIRWYTGIKLKQVYYLFYVWINKRI